LTEKEELVKKGYDRIGEKYQKEHHIFDTRKEIGEFRKLLPKHAKILDLGCGAGVPFTKILIEKRVINRVLYTL